MPYGGDKRNEAEGGEGTQATVETTTEPTDARTSQVRRAAREEAPVDQENPLAVQDVQQQISGGSSVTKP